MTSVRLTGAARRDIDQIIDFYITEAGVEVAMKFISTWERALSILGQNPAIGSPRLAKDLGLGDLRIWPLKGFPHLVVYLNDRQGPEVQRVLHSARDLPPTLQG